MELDGGRLVALTVLMDDPRGSDDPCYVEGFFRHLVGAIKMVPLTEPTSVLVPTDPDNIYSDGDDGGVTTHCVISTSHVAFHSWPLQKRFRLVVDSCKDFSVNVVIDLVRAYFRVNHLLVQDLPYQQLPRGNSHGTSKKTKAPPSTENPFNP